MSLLHPDRFFSPNDVERSIARNLFDVVKDLPIVSPHGHTDPRWFADNENFSDPAALLIQPDHYLLRMLYSQGVPLETLGIQPFDCETFTSDSEKIWTLFAEHYHLFQGTPTSLWFAHALSTVFDVQERLSPDTAADIYNSIQGCLRRDEYRPRALFDRFNIEILATTESPLDGLSHHQKIAQSGWAGKVVTTYRPDPTVDPDYEGFTDNVKRLGELTGEDVTAWRGFLNAHKIRRAFFKRHGATATDHGHPSAFTSNLSHGDCESLYAKVLAGQTTDDEAELFRGQMLTEMARMSLDDGLVMQIHPGVHRNHNDQLFARFGRDKGADLPIQTNYVAALKPLLDVVGNETDLTIILFTLDETTYARELAPLAGLYPCLKLGPPWWFHDSPEGMLRFKRQVLETAGFYNTVGFNDDTRAFLSIPARHDLARRLDCRHLAELVADHRLSEDQAYDLAVLLANGLARTAYRFD